MRHYLSSLVARGAARSTLVRRAAALRAYFEWRHEGDDSRVNP
jgi:site-specific recombinase XerD